MKRIRCFLLCLCFFSACSLNNRPRIKSEYQHYTTENIQALQDVLYIFEHVAPRYYYEPIPNREECVTKTLKSGLSACLDKYSYYVTKAEMGAEEKERAQTNYMGIGVQLEEEAGKILITDVFDNAPASMGGVKTGDVILRVNDEPVEGKGLRGVADLIQGPDGTELTIVVLRDGQEIKVGLRRGKVDFKNVTHKVIAPGTGYVQIKTYAKDRLSRDFSDALRDLTQSRAQGKLILDLRNNGGGIVQEALKSLILFEANRESILIVERGRDEFGNFKETETIASSVLLKNPQLTKFFGRYKESIIVVLVNNNTASASEMVAGYLQQIGATIIGETTHGKGIKQEYKGLTSGAYLKLTTTEYFVGVRRAKVNGVGVKPDIEIKNPTGWVRSDVARDAQLQKAIEILNKK